MESEISTNPIGGSHMKKLMIGITVTAVIGLAGCNTPGNYFGEQKNVSGTKSNVETSNSLSQGEAHSHDSLDIVPTEMFKNIEELAKHSPIVIVGQIKSDSKSFEYSSATFFESQIQVKNIYRDTKANLTKNQNITLLQNDINEVDPIVKKGEKVLLFLKKYDGPVIKNAYRIVGLYQGHFKVDNSGKLVTVGNSNEHKLDTKTVPNLNSLDEALDINPYIPEENVQMSDEEIQKLNENEQQLLEELPEEVVPEEEVHDTSELPN